MDLVINNIERLICHKPTNQPENHFTVCKEMIKIKMSS